MDRPRRIVFQDEVEQLREARVRETKTIHFSDKGSDTGINYSIPTGYRPKPHVVPDYVLKYPGIRNAEERENYKAVFNDQYTEYKELYAEVRTALMKFKELDNMMNKLTSGPQSRKAPERVKAIMQIYDKKKNDSTFMEKRERCIYLKEKLAHIKKQILVYDQQEGSVYIKKHLQAYDQQDRSVYIKKQIQAYDQQDRSVYIKKQIQAYDEQDGSVYF
uniref:OCEL domain-containing protein n=1 Tax=Leptobrachium leishanense TaxID=445787 RepID=A0A8C5WDN5_9ANUR